MKYIGRALIVLQFIIAPSVHGDIFGGDVAVLTQILANNIQQLSQLIKLLETGQRQVELMEDVKRELLQNIDRIRTMGRRVEPGQYGDWVTLEDAVRKLGKEYGSSVPSPNHEVETDTDQSVAEAITLNNELYDYTRQVDETGEEIKRLSQSVSPGGAQKVTAHAQGVLLHVLNQILRAQATMLKLQAQSMAVENRREKLLSQQAMASSVEMERELREKRELFKLPRF